MGAAIDANEVQIWADIDGMHNNDPRIVDHTTRSGNMSFDEAAELAYFGAKILHPATIQPCKDKGIAVLLKNTMDPKSPGTTISDRDDDSKSFHAVAAKDGITVIRIHSARMLMAYGFLRKVFEIFEQYRTPIDMITTSEVAVSLTVDNDKHIDEIVAELRKARHDRDRTQQFDRVRRRTNGIRRRGTGRQRFQKRPVDSDQNDLVRGEPPQPGDADQHRIQETNLAIP